MAARKRQANKIYNLALNGSFGRFSSSGSYPVEYFLTTLKPAEMLEDLTFARDIKMQSLNFDLIMQRDIDEERVRDEMEPYLRPDLEKGSVDIRRRPIFFPPILVAVVPVEEERMLDFYSKYRAYPGTDEFGQETYIREWENLFKLTYYKDEGPDAYELSDEVGAEKVDINDVELELRTAKGADFGARLVVIDGQHRLLALQRVYRRDPNSLSGMVVPVCVLFPPLSFAGPDKGEEELERTPRVTDVFRTLFVDVNETMEKVGGHFTILLSNESVSDVSCRLFCSSVFKHRQERGLAVVEWNTKSRKEAYNITRPYSVTSIGIIKKALDENFKNKSALMGYLLELHGEVAARLNPEGSDEAEYPRVKWDRFSLPQRKVLEHQIRATVVEGLEAIFFGASAFRDVVKVFERALDRLETEAAKEPDNLVVVERILRYRPLKDEDKFGQKVYRKFEEDVREERADKCVAAVGFALFQRAVVAVWAEFLEIGKQRSFDPKLAVGAVVELLDVALSERGRRFSYERFYAQHAIFNGPRIKTIEETKKSFYLLLLAHMGTVPVASRISKALSGRDGDQELVEHLASLGYDAAGDYILTFETERMKALKRTYRVDFSLSAETRESLAEAEAEVDKQKREVREGVRDKNDVTAEFDELARKLVAIDVADAQNALKKDLGFDTDIVATDSADDLTAEDSDDS